MKITHILAGVLAIGACSRQRGPAQDTSVLARQLGESTASPGSNPSKPAPVTPDDPRVMNYSANITPAQQQRATPLPPPAPSATPTPAPAPSSPTSSTPVQPPTSIAPPSTTTETNRPGVFSPPPPPPQ